MMDSRSVVLHVTINSKKMLLENTFSTLRGAASSYCGLTFTKINQNKRDVSHRARFLIIHRHSVVISLDPKLVYFHCKWSKKAKLLMILHSTSLHNTGRSLFLCICSHRWLETDGYDSCDSGNVDKFNITLDVHTTYRVFMSVKTYSS